MLGFLKHLFIPHTRNNHRAKILHHTSLLTVIAILIIVSFLAHVLRISHPDVLGVSYSISSNELLAQVNAQRQQNGLPPLSSSPELDDAARRKAADMLSKNYWAHFAPDGSSSPWGFIRASGYNYQFAGENLAKGFTDSNSVVAAWMGSSTHRANILSGNYKDVGFAIVPGTLQGEETVLVVEMFGTNRNQTLAAVSKTSNEAAPVISSNSASVSPTPTKLNVAHVASSAEVASQTPKIDGAVTSKAVTSVGLTFLVFGFLMDALIVERKKVPRIVGHNIDHIMLILGFILFLIIMKGGVIL